LRRSRDGGSVSAIPLHRALAALVELHGSSAVLEALRDACHCASDFTADAATRGESECWKKAGDAIGFAASDVDRAERGVTDLESALIVLDELQRDS
jgi:hypothetical protein